jgi:uncharacterized protein YdcH (DUF465 family)
MSNAEWITDRPPTEADGDHIGSVHVKMHPRGGSFCRIYWSHVAAGAPWQHTSHWQPLAEPTPTEPDRIAAMVKRLEELEGVAELPGGLPDLELRVAELERDEDAVGLLYSHLQSRLAKLEGAQDDGSAPKWTLNRITALEQQLKEHIRAQSGLAAILVKRLEALEGLPPDGAIPEGGRGVPGGIAALEQRVAESIHALEQRLSSLEQLFWAHKHLDQRVAELEATIKPSAESPEDISYQQLKVEQMRTSAALLIAHANLIEAQP